MKSLMNICEISDPFISFEAYEIGSDDTTTSESAAFIIAKLRQEVDRVSESRSVVFRLLQKLLHRVTRGELTGWNLIRADSGAPRLTRNGEPAECNVSISYSGRWLALAVARNTRVGIDIERIEKRDKFREIASYLDWKIKPESLLEFFYRWTLWEACVKCIEGSVLMSNNRAFEALELEISPDSLTTVDPWCAFQRKLESEICFTVVQESTSSMNRVVRLIEYNQLGIRNT